jgi:hypothetical protein
LLRLHFSRAGRAQASACMRCATARAHLVEHLGHGDERGAVLLLLGGLQLRHIVQPLLGVHAEQVAPHAERLAQRVRHLRAWPPAGDVQLAVYVVTVTPCSERHVREEGCPLLGSMTALPNSRTANPRQQCQCEYVGSYKAATYAWAAATHHPVSGDVDDIARQPRVRLLQQQRPHLRHTSAHVTACGSHQCGVPRWPRYIRPPQQRGLPAGPCTALCGPRACLSPAVTHQLEHTVTAAHSSK